ncbi:MAG: GGDEF domain-containing protein [Myxococcota bacterium]
MTDEWDDEATVVGNKDIARKALAGISRDRAYVIVIAGPNVGEMFKVDGLCEIGRAPSVKIHLTDTEISRRHARILTKGGRVFVEDLGSTNGTFVNGDPIEVQSLEDGDKIQIGTTTILKFSYSDDLDEEFQRRMYDAALRDGLTGAYNKQYFVERLDAEFAFAARHQAPLSLVLFDLDHFKKINDTHGHLAGDYVLKTLAEGILQSVRREDVFARYGGEEFVVLSRGLTLRDAELFGERLREWVEGFPFVHGGTKIPVTISSGVAAIPETAATGPNDLVKHADDALYAAKRGGRNQVRTASNA